MEQLECPTKKMFLFCLMIASILLIFIHSLARGVLCPSITSKLTFLVIFTYRIRNELKEYRPFLSIVLISIPKSFSFSHGMKTFNITQLYIRNSIHMNIHSIPTRQLNMSMSMFMECNDSFHSVVITDTQRSETNHSQQHTTVPSSEQHSRLSKTSKPRWSKPDSGPKSK